MGASLFFYGCCRQLRHQNNTTQQVSYRLHNPPETQRSSGTLLPDVCSLFTVQRGVSINPHLLTDLHNPADIKLCCSAALSGHWGLFWFRELYCFFSLIPSHTNLSFLPLSAVFFYKAWIWKCYHLQTINICWKNSHFHSHSSLSLKCYSFIPSIHKKTLFFPIFFFSVAERTGKRTEEHYWQLCSNYQIAELATLPTGSDPDLQLTHMQFTFVLKTNFLLKPLKKDAVKSPVLRKAKKPVPRDCQPLKSAIRAESAELLSEES